MLVRGEARRGGIVVLQCVRDELKGFPTLEIPEWMFDSNLCGRMKPAEIPRVDCAALLALKHLVLTAEKGFTEVATKEAGSIFRKRRKTWIAI